MVAQDYPIENTLTPQLRNLTGRISLTLAGAVAVQDIETREPSDNLHDP